MAAAYLGYAVVLDGDGNVSQSVTVPDGTDYCVAIISGWVSGADPTASAMSLAGVSMLPVQSSFEGTSNGNSARLFHCQVTATGSQTYAATWSGGWTEGGMAILLFCSGIRASGGVRSAYSTGTSSGVLTTLNFNLPTQDGDLVLVAGAGFNDTAVDVDQSGQTKIFEENTTAYQSDYYAAAYKAATGALTQIKFAGNYAAAAAIALIPAGPPVRAGSPRKKRGTRRNFDLSGWFNPRAHVKGWFWRGWKPSASGTGYTQSVSGSLSFSGASAGRANKALTAALSFAGSVARSVSKSMSAALSFAGAAVKSTSRAVAGTLSFIGAHARSLLKMQSLTAALSFSGAVARNTAKGLAASLASSGAITRACSKGISAALSFVGAVAKSTRRAIAGTLSFIGAHAKSLLKLQAFTAALTFSGSVSRRGNKALSAALSFTGNIAKACAKALSASLAFAGSVARRCGKALAASASFAGSLARRTARSVSASLSFIGSLVGSFLGSGGTVFQKAVSGALSFTGQQVRLPQKAFNAALDFTGGMGRAIAKALAGTLGFLVRLLTPQWLFGPRPGGARRATNERTAPSSQARPATNTSARPAAGSTQRSAATSRRRP